MNTEEKQKRFLEAYRLNGGNISAACEVANIHRSTHYEWIKNDESDEKGTYAQLFSEAEESLYDLVESKLMQQIEYGNVQSIIFFCKTKLKHRGYVERVENDVNHKGEIKSALDLTFGFEADSPGCFEQNAE